MAQTSDDAPALFARAASQFDAGAFEPAIATWRKAVAAAPPSQTGLRVRAQLGIAAACQRIGLYEEARRALSAAQNLLSERSDPELTAQLHLQAGNLSLAAHRYAEALESLTTASAQASLTARRDLHAIILNDYANALAASGYAIDAIAAYGQARERAVEAGLEAVVLAATINMARVQWQRGDLAAGASIESAAKTWRSMRRNFDWALAGLALVELGRQAGQSDQDEAGVLREVEIYAKESKNSRLLALTYLAFGDAEEATLRQAIFFASQAQAQDVLYEAQWRLAQLQRRQGRLEDALASFGHALAALNPIRDELLNGSRDSQRFFQSRIRPVYTDYVDALMSSATDAAPPERSVRLERARNIIEALRGAELQDYFRDECVVEGEARAPTPQRALQGVAILYPIVLADRVELLMSIDGVLHRHTVDVTQEQLGEAALRLREFVQDASHERFRPYAARLHRWLIEPIRAQLQAAEIETLVVVPDGVLRTVPFAVLHDGDRYLIEDYSVAVTPALRLTALAAPMKSNNVLLAGVAQPVQGFAPLPEVATELRSIRSHTGGRILADRDYTKSNLRSALLDGRYNIVHMATHSTVSAASNESFLLTYDGKLTMTDLESALRSGDGQSRIDLLTLSACETAIGDERAALGLAGMAVKSGAASVIASLWKVDDAATAALMEHFYGQLQGEGAQKARALRSAQLRLLADAGRSHPAHWAAFMLIGSWQ